MSSAHTTGAAAVGGEGVGDVCRRDRPVDVGEGCSRWPGRQPCGTGRRWRAGYFLNAGSEAYQIAIQRRRRGVTA